MPKGFLQRTRHSINERLHLRLWLTPMRFEGQSVWVGQVSRDIGARLTWRTWWLDRRGWYSLDRNPPCNNGVVTMQGIRWAPNQWKSALAISRQLQR
nr:LssY C-terminal domain-containing protein [Allorhodopirellula heiligendammensis]